jgi:hypothetical protein
LDLYHVCDYLAAVWPGDIAEVHRHRDALKVGQLDEVLAALRYLENRLDQLDYPAAIRAGLPVGSGLIESAHRHLLQSRLKIAGAWWPRAHAHHLAQLRIIRANGLWDSYWRN